VSEARGLARRGAELLMATNGMVLGYVYLRQAEVARTIEVTDSIMVDLWYNFIVMKLCYYDEDTV
jgi:hypothetical protein